MMMMMPLFYCISCIDAASKQKCGSRGTGSHPTMFTHFENNDQASGDGTRRRWWNCYWFDVVVRHWAFVSATVDEDPRDLCDAVGRDAVPSPVPTSMSSDTTHSKTGGCGWACRGPWTGDEVPVGMAACIGDGGGRGNVGGGGGGGGDGVVDVDGFSIAGIWSMPLLNEARSLSFSSG